MSLAYFGAGNLKLSPDPWNTKSLLSAYCLCLQWVRLIAFFAESLTFLLLGCLEACSLTESEDDLKVRDVAV